MMKILADEGLNGNIVNQLRGWGHEVQWILEDCPGISDEEVIGIAKDGKQLLITEDKDFGEWVFAHRVSGLTVVLLRYEKQDFEIVLNSLRIQLELLSAHILENDHSFITINKNKTRKRTI